MGTLSDDGIDEPGGVRPDLLGPGEQAFPCHAGLRLMRGRHVFTDGGEAFLPERPGVARHPAGLDELFGARGRHARIELLPDQLVGNGVVMMLDGDVIIDVRPQGRSKRCRVATRRRRKQFKASPSGVGT